MLKAIALFLIKGYQRYVSPYKGFKCAYGQLIPGSVSCSAYAVAQLNSMPLKPALNNIQVRLTCCHEVHRLFSSLSVKPKYPKVPLYQRGVIDSCDVGDCGAGSCDVGGCVDFHSCVPEQMHIGSCGFGANDAIDLVADATEACTTGTNKSSFTTAGTTPKVKLSKKFALIHASSAGPLLFRHKQNEKIYLVNDKKELLGLDLSKKEISPEEALAWMQKDA